MAAVRRTHATATVAGGGGPTRASGGFSSAAVPQAAFRTVAPAASATGPAAGPATARSSDRPGTAPQQSQSAPQTNSPQRDGRERADPGAGKYSREDTDEIRRQATPNPTENSRRSASQQPEYTQAPGGCRRETIPTPTHRRRLPLLGEPRWHGQPSDENGAHGQPLALVRGRAKPRQYCGTGASSRIPALPTSLGIFPSDRTGRHI